MLFFRAILHNGPDLIFKDKIKLTLSTAKRKDKDQQKLSAGPHLEVFA